VTVATPRHGNIFSTGALNCGSAGTDCQEVFGAAQTVSLTATPDSGYQLAGWTDDCSGGAAITLHVNGPKQCSARFELIASPDPRTLIVIDSQPGDFVGGGKAQVYSPANSRISIPTLWLHRHFVEFQRCRRRSHRHVVVDLQHGLRSRGSRRRDSSGDYDFVFVAEGRSGVVSRHEVRVTLNPRVK
jgi:hypothetical protein